MERSVAITKPLKIFSGGAMRPLLRELVPIFERVHGATVEPEFRLSAAVKRAIQDGAIFDLALLPRPELVGASKPDIGSVCCRRVPSATVMVQAGPMSPDYW
jgi:hypothetical protein